ncbi:hypothetical protein WMY93_016214 [Mugilogobius chulae]|uniref:DUF6729 domain-containing protein n=1 Tax=Mugilogobius chulae TaxID=88201 RepID=A0AAW0NT78_9GOBI
MASKPKSHKAMDDGEWMSRLRSFATTGVWPAGEGNRPAPRQKKWHDLYQKILKCPMQARGQTTLFGGTASCICGFHTHQLPTASTPVPQALATEPPAHTFVRPGPSLSKFTKSRFGGAHLDALKPNVTARKITSPSPPTSLAQSASSAQASSSARIIPNPVPSPFSIMPEHRPSYNGKTPTQRRCATTADPSTCFSFWLPFDMAKTIPPQDQKWIANTLFQNGKLRPDLKLWYDPPGPALIYHQPPTPDRFFTHRLLVWMPYHLWRLTGYGVHKKARKLLDIDRYYLMITETLRCTACNLNFISSSQTVRNQLDLPHQKLFRLIITRMYACDIRVIRLLRDRTLGNSPARLVKQLKENHGEEWMSRMAHYLGELTLQEPPEPIAIPTSHWILSVYAKDILSRLDHVKASITSTFGSIIKLDSTKKITKKLAGHGKGTALWMTSVGNEVGQILTCVLSVQEGPGLDKMVAGLMERYRQAAVPPPVLLYVDCGCCVREGESKLQSRFSQWPDLHIRLDIWHFMRRLAVGCTTDAHALFPSFMGSLSACIFEWDAADLSLLQQAKKEQLRQEGVPGLTDSLVNAKITKTELSTYCRRRTRGEETTTKLIEKLLSELGGARGRDLMGVPLLDQVRMEHIWQVQKKHVKCIQDVPDVQLYTAVGTTTVGGKVLTRYRCARGSTSLESFHLHLNRFIPGTTANALHFQLYLLEGLNRWNQDRQTAAVASQPSSLLSYAGDLAQSINTNSYKVFGRPLIPTFTPPAQYTGELLGVDYLLSQTGQPLKINPDSEETEVMLEDVNEQAGQEEEGFEELGVDSLSNLFDDENFSASSITAVCPASSVIAVSLASLPWSSLDLALPSITAVGSAPPSSQLLHCSGYPALLSHPLQWVLRSSSHHHGVGPSCSGQLLHHSVGQLLHHCMVSSSSLPAFSGSPSFTSLSPASSITSVGPAPPSLHGPASTITSVSPASTITSVSPASSITSVVSLPSLSGPPPPSLQWACLMTAPVTLQELSTAVMPAPTSAESSAVDESGIPGIDKVDNLAKYLVELRTQTSLTLRSQQVIDIVGLWENMEDYDKQRIVFAARHQTRLIKGRFKCPKRREEFTPGVDSVKRHALTTTAPLAQWPDCSRLTELIFIRLCTIYRSPKKKGNGTVSRWDLIMEDYRKIRRLIVGNMSVMTMTNLQLVDISHTTLVQWHNKRVKRQDNTVLMQGLTFPVVCLILAPPPGQPHQYNLPSSTVGQAKVKRRLSQQPPVSHPPQPAPVSHLQQQPAPVSHLQQQPAPVSHLQQQPAPVSQDPQPSASRVQLRPLLPMPHVTPQTVPQIDLHVLFNVAVPPTTVKRKVNRKEPHNRCRKCGQLRTKDTGHSQFKGIIYCPSVETSSKEEWLEEMKKKANQ